MDKLWGLENSGVDEETASAQLHSLNEQIRQMLDQIKLDRQEADKHRNSAAADHERIRTLQAETSAIIAQFYGSSKA